MMSIFSSPIAATQIHSSLLSLSVGAVLLPAAFHFTLAYRDGSENIKERIDEQKKDILRMSHGVSFDNLAITSVIRSNRYSHRSR